MRKNHLLSFCLLLFGVIALSSCVQGDMFDEMYEFGDLNSAICRKKGAKDTSSCPAPPPDYYSSHKNVKYFYITSSLFGNTTCAFDCLLQKTNWKRRDITKKFKEIDEEEKRNGRKNKIGRDVNDIATVVSLMGGYTCQPINASDLQKGDIAITKSQLNLVADDNGKEYPISSSVGHAFIIEEIEYHDNRPCYMDSSPYCVFDVEYIQGGYRITPN